METNIGLFLKLRQSCANQNRRKLFMPQLSETGEERKRFFLWEKPSLGVHSPGAEARLLQSPFKGQVPDFWTNSDWTQPWVHFTWLGKPTPVDGPSVHHPPLQLPGSENVVHSNDQSTWTKPIPEPVLPLSFFLPSLFWLWTGGQGKRVMKCSPRAGKEHIPIKTTIKSIIRLLSHKQQHLPYRSKALSSMPVIACHNQVLKNAFLFGGWSLLIKMLARKFTYSFAFPLFSDVLKSKTEKHAVQYYKI